MGKKMRKQAKIHTLEGETSGKWLVTTRQSEYEIDLDEMVAKRIAGKKANRWHDEDVVYPLKGVPHVYVGDGIVMPVDHVDECVYSTPVKSIVPMWDDAA